MTEVVVDVEWALRDWLRADPSKPSDIGVYLDVPRGTPDFPFIEIVGRIGGTVDDYVDIESPRISFAVWGGPKGAGYDDANYALRYLVKTLKGFENASLDEDSYVYSATDINIVKAFDISDPENKIARYIVDSTVTVRSI